MASLVWAGLSGDQEEDVPECSGQEIYRILWEKFCTQKVRPEKQTSSVVPPVRLEQSNNLVALEYETG